MVIACLINQEFKPQEELSSPRKRMEKSEDSFIEEFNNQETNSSGKTKRSSRHRSLDISNHSYSKQNAEFFENLKKKQDSYRAGVMKSVKFTADDLLPECENSKGFEKLKKKFKGNRLKEKILNSKAEQITIMHQERANEMKKFFGKKLANQIMQGSLTKEHKIKRSVRKKGTVMPQLFATEYISQRKLKELRAQQKIVMRMNLTNEKFAYSIVSKNLQEYFKNKKGHDSQEFEFLITNVKMKKGPVMNMLEVFKNEFNKETDNLILRNKAQRKVKRRGKLWSSQLGSGVEVTKKALEKKQRYKYKNNRARRLKDDKRGAKGGKKGKRSDSADSEASIKSSLSITEMKLETLYEQLRVVKAAIEHFGTKKYQKGDIQKRKKFTKIMKKIQGDIFSVISQKHGQQ